MSVVLLNDPIILMVLLAQKQACQLAHLNIHADMQGYPLAGA